VLSIAPLFGVARCTVCVIVHDTCDAIIHILQSKYLFFPVGDVLESLIDGFKMIQCAGVIDGCHILVRPPALNHTDYYNRKGWYSVILKAVEDDKYLFKNVMVGWPGSVHDARVLSNKDVIHTKQCNGKSFSWVIQLTH
jgi:hypothetical protein